MHLPGDSFIMVSRFTMAHYCIDNCIIEVYIMVSIKYYMKSNYCTYLYQARLLLHLR